MSNRLACSALAALALGAAAAFAASPATATAPATTAPASAAATAPAGAEDVKAAVVSLMQASFAGDEKTALDLLYFSSDNAKKEAQAALGIDISRTQCEKAIATEFKADPPDIAPMVAMIKSMLQEATVTISGDTAQIAMSPGSTMYLVRDKGAWKIDFDKTQRASEGPFNQAKVDADTRKVEIYKSMITDVAAHKFKTREEAEAELQRRLSAVPAPTSPTTTGATPTGPAGIEAATPIGWEDAKKNVGKTATVSGPVISTHTTTDGTHINLNVGKDYPDTARFTVYIPADPSIKNPDDTYKGKTITVTGKIILYQNAPEIQAKAADITIQK